ncbi:hypothetical protein [Novosphingobium panipatense]|uniref:Flagellar protein FliL n=2 Tax=Novosphingobium panipatense TaxID=428991 RepID=A0ABY1QND4_9SPHN|nr:hypothetical protein SAMN06296065_10962 [Novosphingobium panipatense]
MLSLRPCRAFFSALMLLWTAPALAANTEPRQAEELPPPDPIFVSLEPIAAPIVDGGRVDGVLHLSIVIKAKSADDAAALGKNIPKLRAAALSAAIEFARLWTSRFTPVNVGRLAAMLKTSVKRADNAVDTVLIVKVSAREQ